MEEEAKAVEKYWEKVEEKTNSILEILKGVSYKQIRSIQRNLDEKVRDIIDSSIVL